MFDRCGYYDMIVLVCGYSRSGTRLVYENVS